MSDLTSRLAQLSPEQRALLAARVAAARAPEIADEAIAIIGMSCRLPGGANSPEALWDVLTNGVDTVSPVPRDRWDAEAFFDADADAPGRISSRDGAFIDGVAEFDPAYFGIAPVEARQMDPQQRLFLEVAMEALEQAGQTRAQLAGSMCGVFVGVHAQSIDYYLMQVAARERVDTYTGTGTAHSVVANRLSYFLDLRGPSMAIDTACSSSLVAFHQACLSLRARESSLAVVGGVNLMLSPDASVTFTKLRILSPGGRCRTFDAAADGIARGEGCAAVVLKRAADALRDGDPILALVRGTAVNQDGATNGLTAPSTLSQVAMIRTALAVANLAPERVTFVETHGTGTALGDPIEVEAIAGTYGAPRANGSSVVLGALKTNIGHLEAAAGLAGVIKTVLCLQHRHIPQNLHFGTLNPLVRLDGTSIELASTARAWPADGGTRIGAVSSFGFGGTNAHAILEEAPPVAATAPAVDAGAVLPLVLSAHTAPALRAQVEQWRVALRTSLAAASARDIAGTAATRRTHLGSRVAVTGTGAADWADRLDVWARALEREALPPLHAGERRKVAFLFSGQGPQWFAMGRALMDTEPLVRDVVTRVSAVVEGVAGWSLLEELARNEGTTRIHRTEITQPALFALQMALVALWRAWGVEPDMVVGHSVGEIAAACAAGAIDLEEGARIAVLRGRAMSAADGSGVMIAFPITAAAARDVLAGLEDRVGIAALNAPDSLVLAGAADAMSRIAATLAARGIEGRTIDQHHAFHSPPMEPFAAPLRSALGTVAHRAPSVPMYSTIAGALVTHASLDSGHWCAGIRRTVDFVGGVHAALDAGCQVFVDIGPHPVLGAYAREAAEAAGIEVASVASLRRKSDDRAQMMQAAAELFTAGVDLQWGAVLGGRTAVIDLPAYPWQHAHYWIDRPVRQAAAEVATDHVAPSDDVRELHAVTWAPHDAAAPRRASPPPSWIVLGGETALAGALASALRHDGTAVHLVSGSDVATALAAVRPGGGEIIDLRATVPVESRSVLARAGHVTRAVQSLLVDVESAVAGSSPLRVWCVTCGAQSVAGGVPDVAQAAAWGIGRVAAAEMPATFAGIIDLDPAGDVAQSVAAIVDAVSSEGRAFEHVYRAGRPLVLRLASHVMPASAPALRADGYYVVTGGLGGVGLVVANWLAQRGATRVLLVGRSALPPREQWGDASLTPDQQRRIAGVQRIEAHGAEACLAALDVNDAASLARVAAERRAAGWGDVRGILHCATGTHFGLLRDVTVESIDAMLRPKLGGAKSLLEVFGADAPDFLVLFSTLGALLGERGQGVYAAANAALDAWGLARRCDGLPVSVVNWGAWEGTGLAATRGGELVAEGLTEHGVLPVSPDRATAALGAVIAHRVPQAVVFRGAPATAAVDAGRDAWSALSALAPVPDTPDTPDTPATPVTSVVDELRAIEAPRARLARLVSIVRDLIGETLGLTDTRLETDRPLGTMGMDSLLAVRIRRRCERVFGLTLPATLLFSYPTVLSLAEFLAAELHLSAGEAATAQVEPAMDVAAVSGLSDDDALAALRGRRPSRRSVS